MAFRRRFEIGLAWRTAALAAAIAAMVAAFSVPDLGAVRIVASVGALALLWELWRYIGHTNRELARFVEALRFGDHAQRFGGLSGAGFDVIGDSLDTALKAMRDRQVGLADEISFLAAALDDAPVALLAIDADGRVTLLGKAARRLFDHPVVTHVEDLAVYGAELAATLALPPGGRRLTRIVLDGMPQHVLVGTARLERLGRDTTVVSVLKVQTELGQLELTAQADLVRVLTHEIMNSLTPVTSLAQSSADLVHAARDGDPGALTDASAAADAVAARAGSILRFVASYRDFAASPDVRRRAFLARGWVDEVLQLARADPRIGAMAIEAVVEPDWTKIDGDPDLLAQVMLNLIRNAALAGAKRCEVGVHALRHGHSVLEVSDDGPGIPEKHREDVFLPFYTTRKDGSGVGLSFARQVALAHGGSIAADRSRLGGASVKMAF
ncbi:ATP-binding protein [Sphingomonas sp. 1P06PA]|uniref:sensor histidine kinase n=1 Tax=Sphingomonas sp. 1P06PA TaxID=554121 RepID=UPI0039A66798